MLKSEFMTWYGSIALSILVPSYKLTHIVSIIHMRILIPSCIPERIGSISLHAILSIGSIIHIRQCCFHKCIGSIIHIAYRHIGTSMRMEIFIPPCIGGPWVWYVGEIVPNLSVNFMIGAGLVE